jgi:hypothetical protein
MANFTHFYVMKMNFNLGICINHEAK